MNKLSFDVEAAKEQLTQLFRDRVSAQGSAMNVLSADIEAVDFSGMPQQIPNQDQLVFDMKADLTQAQTHAQSWFNDVQPHLTLAPQAAINYAALWNQVTPLVLDQLQQATPDRARLQQLFEALEGSIDEQVTALSPLLASLQSIRGDMASDAANFSSKHASFQQLEDIDKEGIASARTTLAQVKAMVDAYDQEIDVDIIKADKDLALASNAMKYGGKVGTPGKITGLTIGLIFIVSASFAIDDLISAVDARLAAAEKAGEYKLELTLLTAQLVNLEETSSALSALVQELDDMITSLQQAIAGWQSERAAISQVVADLAGTLPIGQVLSQFDLGQTQAEWDDLSTFATKWQTMEVSARANDLVLGTSDS